MRETYEELGLINPRLSVSPNERKRQMRLEDYESFIGPVRFTVDDGVLRVAPERHRRRRHVPFSLWAWILIFALVSSLAGNAYLIAKYQKVRRENAELIEVIEYVADSILEVPAFKIPKLKKMPLEI